MIYKQLQKLFHLKLNETIYKSNCILDVGCSAGSIEAKDLMLNKFVIGIDNYFDRLKQNKSYKHKIVADIYNLPFKNIKFDFIIIKYVMEHLEHPAAAVENLDIFLKKNGFVYVVVPKFYAFQDTLYRFLGKMCEILKKGKQAHIQNYSFASLLSFFYEKKYFLDFFYEAEAGLSFLDKTSSRRKFKKIVVEFINIIKIIFHKNLLERNEMHFLIYKR